MKKKNFTLKLLLLLIAGFTIHSAAYAQSVTVNVPGDFPSVSEAIQAHEETASQITVNIAEGIHEETYHHFWAWNGDIEITVQGAGANETFIQPLGVTEMPDLQNDTANHWWQLNPMGDPDYNGSLTFKDLTFRYWGKPGNRGLFMFQKHANATEFESMIVTFENVVFDSNIGQSLFQMDWMDAYGLHFDNCLFINNVTTPDLDGGGGDNRGLINIRHHRAERGATNAIRNSTFYGNVAYRNEASGPRGRLIDFSGWNGRESELIISNVVAVENTLAGTPQEGVHPLVTFDIAGGNNGTNLSVEKFTSIGNIRIDEELDFDILLTGDWENPNLIFAEDENILQRLALRVSTPDPDDPDDGDPTITYEPVEDWWFTKVSPHYAYTHPDILFTMDGDVPALLEDEHGVGYVEFSGDGGDPDVPPPVVFTGADLVSWADEPDYEGVTGYADNPYDNPQYTVRRAPEGWNPVSDVETFESTWELLGDPQNIANITDDRGGDLFDLDNGATFGAQWQAVHDGEVMYVLLKYWDTNNQNHADFARSFEIMAQPTSPVRHEDTHAAGVAANDVAKQNMAYGRYVELGGGKAEFVGGEVTEYVASIGLTGAWGANEPGMLAFLELDDMMFWSEDDGVIMAVLPMDFDGVLSYPNDPEEVDGARTGVSVNDVFAFDIKSNARVGGTEDANRVEYFWASDRNNGYASNYYSGHLTISNDPVTSVLRPEPKASTLHIFSHNGVVVVEGLKANDLLHVYDIKGSLVDVVIPRGADRVEVSSLPKGIYIIRSLARPDERAQRVIVF